MKLVRLTLMLAPLLLLTACATSPERAHRDQARLIAVHAAAGKPVNSFNYVASTLYSWIPLSTHELLVYTRPNQAWLLNVGVCPDLPYTAAIGLTSRMNQVSKGFDSVIVYGGNFPCYIRKIQPVDVALLKHIQQRPGGKIVSEPASKPAAQ